MLALLLLALIAAAPLWTGPGLVNTRSGGDSPFLFIRLHQLVENLHAGILPARWMPDAAYGLGYPFFNFYAALPYYFASIFNLIGFDLLASIKIVQSLGFVFAAWAMHGWVRSASRDAPHNRTMAWLAAVAYTFAPFHLVNVYVRGDSLAEFYAFVFFPLILWAVDRVIEHPRPRTVAVLALAYGGLILTHNVSALIFSPFVLLYMVFRCWRLEIGGHGPRSAAEWGWRNRLRHSALHILHCSFGILLGLLVSAWFWLPALGEAPLVQLDVQTTGYFNYNEHFRSTDLIQSSLGFDYSTEPPHTPFAMGLAQAVATLGGVAALIAARRGSTGFRAFILIGLAISTAMITPLSKPLWDSLPLLPLTQFPWRFLSVQALFASAAIGHLGALRTAPTIVGTPPFLAAASGLALAASTLLPLRPNYLPIRADEITPERIQLYEAFTTNIGTTIRAEYLPRTANPRPYTGPALIDPTAPPRVIPVRGEATAEQTAKGPVSQSWIVQAASEATLAFPTLYFPGWRASVDGEDVDTRASVDLGYIEVSVPAGEHTLALWLDRTPTRASAEIMSLVALLLISGLLATQRRETKDGGRKRASLVKRLSSFVSSERYELMLLALAALFAALVASANAVAAHDADLVMDFKSKPWLHHSGADFGAARLAQYEYAQPLAAGAPFGVLLVWTDVANEAVAMVQLVTPSLHAFGGPEPPATASAPIQVGVNHYALHVPDALAKGMYYVKVEVSTASGKSTTAYLSPIFYGEPPTASESSDWGRIGQEIELKSVAVKHDERDRLTVAFDWVALKPIAANYALSLRLQDESGHVWVSLDTQPGYGFLPTSAWLPGEIQHDAYTLALPPDTPRDGVYGLAVVWYRVASQQEIGRVRIPGIRIDSLYGEMNVPPPSRSFDVPPMQQRVDATFGGIIRLLGYDISQSGDRLTLTLHWQALADIGADYKFFVHVIDPATEHIAAQVDARPGRDAYPTWRWMKSEVVTERFQITVAASGVYRVATGWYDPISTDRLPTVDDKGNPLPGNRVFIGEEVIIS